MYESWSLPISVLISTPVAVLGAFLALWARRFENNVYVQIGLIMLIGLSAKNAILIVEFAKAEVERGKSLIEAALTGARIRLRPILMTSFAFVFGCLPLWFATGSGGDFARNTRDRRHWRDARLHVAGHFHHPGELLRCPSASRTATRKPRRRPASTPQSNHELAAFALSPLRPCWLAAARLDPTSKLPTPTRPPPFAARKAGTNSLGDLAWWQLFQDPALQDLIRTALTNNYDLRLAAARVEESRALLAQSRSVFYPQVGYQATTSPGRNAVGGTPYYTGQGSQKYNDIAGKRVLGD